MIPLDCFVPNISQCLFQSQGRTLTIATTVHEGGMSRLGCGKIQKRWQWTQTVTSLNNLQTRKLLCQAELKGEKKGVTADRKFHKKELLTHSESESLRKKIKNGLISRRCGVSIWFGGTRCSHHMSALTYSCLVREPLGSARQEGGGRTDWRNSKTNYFIWKAALIIKQGWG